MVESCNFTIRKAKLDDTAHISELSRQLGYPVEEEDLIIKLKEVLDNDEHTVLVTDVEGFGATGWVHVFVKHLFYSEPAVEIGGLVVHDSFRKKGLGKALMQGAEQWAMEKGCSGVVLRSNETRKEAHAFYKGIGYTHIKNHLTFYKGF